MKRWRRWAIAAAAVTGLAAALYGALVASGLVGNSATKPAGSETVLRIQSVDTKVSCGANGVVVYIYLDDLARRPSPLNANAAAGLAAFELPLRYDPKVLQIGSPANIELNPELNREDDDADGVVRTFLPVSNINDAAGWAVLGAASYNPSSQGSDQANREEGLDPVAHGEPVLLMTVRFQTIGEGEGTVTIEPTTTIPGRPPQEVKLFDPSNKDPVYKSVIVKGATITVSGGDCSAVTVSTPLPTPLPSSTPYVEPTETPVVWKTVTPHDAASVGRTDCPQGWAAYADPRGRFSLCYPADFGVTASDYAVNAHSPSSEGQKLGLVSLAVGWSSSPGTVYYPPSPENCDKYQVEGYVSSSFLDLTLSGIQVPACLSRGVLEGTPAVPVANLQGAIPLAKDNSDREGFITFALGFTSSDIATLPEIGKAVLDTLVISFR